MSNIMSSPSPKDTVLRGVSNAVGGRDTFEPSKDAWVWSGQGDSALAAASDDAPGGEDDDELDEEDDDELDEDEDEDEDEEDEDEEDDDAGPGH